MHETERIPAQNCKESGQRIEPEHFRTREWAGISSGCQHRPGLRLPEHGSTRGARGGEGSVRTRVLLAPIYIIELFEGDLALAEDPGLGLGGCRLVDARGMVHSRSEARSHHPSAAHT